MTRDNRTEKKQRNIGLDFLKVLAMLMVVTIHTLGHGGVLEATEPLSANYQIAWLLQSFVYCAVDVYVIITGFLYADREIRFSRIVLLWIMTFFYSAMISIGLYVLRPYVGFMTVVSGFFPLITKQYWFFNAYFALFCFIPVLNTIAAERRRLKYVITISFLLFSVLPLLGLQKDLFTTNKGYSFLWFAVLYLCGAYLKKYGLPEKLQSGRCLLGIYLASAVLLLLSRNILTLLTEAWLGEPKYAGLFYTYTSPLVLLPAFSLVALFKDISIRTRIVHIIVETLAPYTFGVYLIHDNPNFRNWIILDRFAPYAGMAPVKMALCTLATILGIYMCCSLADYIRAKLFTLLSAEKAAGAIERVISAYLEIPNKEVSKKC